MTRTALIVTGFALAGIAGGLAALPVAPAVAPAVATTPAPSANPRRAAAEQAFEALKALEGTWMQADESGTVTDEIASIYHVTAGGNAVAETMFPGSDHEMLTVYFIEDDTLKMTHYCTLGNRPVLDCIEPGAHAMTFECGEDDCCAGEMHMHRATFKLVDATHISTTWGSNEPADAHDAMTFYLVRRAEHEVGHEPGHQGGSR